MSSRRARTGSRDCQQLLLEHPQDRDLASPSWHWAIEKASRGADARPPRPGPVPYPSAFVERQAIGLIAHGRGVGRTGEVMSVAIAQARTTGHGCGGRGVWLSFLIDVIFNLTGRDIAPARTRGGPDGNDALPGLLYLG